MPSRKAWVQRPSGLVENGRGLQVLLGESILVKIETVLY